MEQSEYEVANLTVRQEFQRVMGIQSIELVGSRAAALVGGQWGAVVEKNYAMNFFRKGCAKRCGQRGGSGLKVGGKPARERQATAGHVGILFFIFSILSCLGCAPLEGCRMPKSLGRKI